MKQLECKSCGAPIKPIGFGRYICEYCGSMYEDDGYGSVKFIEIRQQPIEQICAECTVENHLIQSLGEEKSTKLTLRELSNQLAQGLVSYMKIHARQDPLRQVTIVRGEVRVVPPDHRI